MLGAAFAGIVSTTYLGAGQGLSFDVGTGDYSLEPAGTSSLGGIKLGHDSKVTAPSSYAPATNTTDFTLMPLQLDSNGNAVIGISRQYYKNIVGASASAIANAASSNGGTYLNAVAGGAVVSSHKIIGSGNTSVGSDSSGNITINNTYSHPQLMECDDAIRGSVAYDHYNGNYVSANGESFSCTCDPTNGYVDFSMRVKIANSNMGIPIADFKCQSNQLPLQMALNNTVPFYGCPLLSNINGLFIRKYTMCDVEATGLDKVAYYHGVDCNDLSNSDHCATIVSGIAVWIGNAVWINFGTEQWGPGNENTIFLHCSGMVDGCYF